MDEGQLDVVMLVVVDVVVVVDMVVVVVVDVDVVVDVVVVTGLGPLSFSRVEMHCKKDRPSKIAAAALLSGKPTVATIDAMSTNIDRQAGDGVGSSAQHPCIQGTALGLRLALHSITQFEICWLKGTVVVTLF